MPTVKYFKDNKPIQVDWKRNDETNEMYLVLNGKVEPAFIELKKTTLSGGYIIARYKNQVVETAMPFELGLLKKRILSIVYNINFKYVEV